jgi:hypothetical protein
LVDGGVIDGDGCRRTNRTRGPSTGGIARRHDRWERQPGIRSRHVPGPQGHREGDCQANDGQGYEHSKGNEQPQGGRPDRDDQEVDGE